MAEIGPILACAALFVWALSRAIVRIITASKGASPVKMSHVEDLEEEMEELRERIEVLEKIITDQKYQLEKEFRDLAG